jgi:hypothetical protein
MSAEPEVDFVHDLYRVIDSRLELEKLTHELVVDGVLRRPDGGVGVGSSRQTR